MTRLGRLVMLDRARLRSDRIVDHDILWVVVDVGKSHDVAMTVCGMFVREHVESGSSEWI